MLWKSVSLFRATGTNLSHQRLWVRGQQAEKNPVNHAIADPVSPQSAEVQCAVFLCVIGESARSVCKGYRFATEQARKDVASSIRLSLTIAR